MTGREHTAHEVAAEDGKRLAHPVRGVKFGTHVEEHCFRQLHNLIRESQEIFRCHPRLPFDRWKELFEIQK